MDFDSLHSYLHGKPWAEVDFPFDPVTLVFKVCGKMFALIILDEEPMRMNLKCAPDQATALRDCFAAVLPGYHMNKRHWNTLLLDGSLPDDLLRTMIDDSYALVVAGLPKATRQRLGD